MNNFFLIEIKILIKDLFFLFTFFLLLCDLILVFNVWGLCPYVFPLTSHLSVSLRLRIFMWTLLILLQFKNFERFFLHIVPFGCPPVLIFFIVIIETVRVIIRFITLAVRLSANIIAGHMIMNLISMSSIETIIGFTLRLFSQILISLLELGVALIQPYVFFTLLNLYAQEIPFKDLKI